MIGEVAGPEVVLNMLEKLQDATQLAEFVYPTRSVLDPAGRALRAILAPTNRQIDAYNSQTVDLIVSDEWTCLAHDSQRG